MSEWNTYDTLFEGKHIKNMKLIRNCLGAKVGFFLLGDDVLHTHTYVRLCKTNAMNNCYCLLLYARL